MLRAPRLTYSLTEPARQSSPAGAQALARAYLDDVSSYWRGDAGAITLGERIAAFFGSGLPEEPARPADAYSPHGAGGRSIRWYACGDEVLGYIPGCASGYRIPAACVAGLTHAIGMTPQQASAIAVGSQPRTTGGEVAAWDPARLALDPVHLTRPAVTGAVA